MKDTAHFRAPGTRGHLLPDVTGTVVHDCWSPYFKQENADNALCNAHLLRDCRAVAEIDGEKWAATMGKILLDGKKAADAARDAGAEAVAPRTVSDIVRRYEDCVAEALKYHESLPPLQLFEKGKRPRGRIKRRAGHNLALRAEKFQREIFRFLYDLVVPFTNNEAERDLRMCKVRQKVSGCFRTMKGAKNYCTLRTVVETARKQGWDVLDALMASPEDLISELRSA